MVLTLLMPRFMNLTIRQIRYFVATAEIGKISTAAQQLNVTQSAITLSIKKLEETLQVELFVRMPNGVILTKSGQYFLKHCYDILDSLESCRHIHQWSNKVSGSLNIAATHTVMGYFLPQHLLKIQQLYPNIEISLSELPRTKIEEKLQNGSLDIAILLSSNINNPRIKTLPLFKSKRNLWLTENHHLIDKKEITFADISNEAYILLTIDESEQTTFNYWKKTAFMPKIILRTRSTEAVRSMVANGVGITILSDMVYRPWSLEGRRIIKRRLTQDVPVMELGLAWLANKHLSTSEKIFCKYFTRINNIAVLNEL